MTIKEIIEKIKKRIKQLRRWDKEGNLGAINDLKNLLPDLEKANELQEEMAKQNKYLIELMVKAHQRMLCLQRPYTDKYSDLNFDMENIIEKYYNKSWEEIIKT